MAYVRKKFLHKLLSIFYSCIRVWVYESFWLRIECVNIFATVKRAGIRFGQPRREGVPSYGQNGLCVSVAVEVFEGWDELPMSYLSISSVILREVVDRKDCSNR